MASIRRRPLLVFVPDRTGRPESVQSLKDFLKTQAPFNAEDANEPLVCDFHMPWGWGDRDLTGVCDIIATQIDNRFKTDGDKISNIILCGYSLGAMLARRVFLDARGLGNPPEQSRPWAAAVDRIVLVGAVCRGFGHRDTYATDDVRGVLTCHGGRRFSHVQVVGATVGYAQALAGVGGRALRPTSR